MLIKTNTTPVTGKLILNAIKLSFVATRAI
jgi:hypothetical protein